MRNSCTVPDLGRHRCVCSTSQWYGNDCRSHAASTPDTQLGNVLPSKYNSKCALDACLCVDKFNMNFHTHISTQIFSYEKVSAHFIQTQMCYKMLPTTTYSFHPESDLNSYENEKMKWARRDAHICCCCSVEQLHRVGCRIGRFDSSHMVCASIDHLCDAFRVQPIDQETTIAVSSASFCAATYRNGEMIYPKCAELWVVPIVFFQLFIYKHELNQHL